MAPVDAVASGFIEQLRDDLKGAMKARDSVAVTVLRTTLAAIANAEAPARDLSGPADAASVGRLQEHARIELTMADVEGIVRAEAADREDTIARYVAGGRLDATAPLEAELAVLRRYVSR